MKPSERLILGVGSAIIAGALLLSKDKVGADLIPQQTPTPTPTPEATLSPHPSCVAQLEWGKPGETPTEIFIPGDPNRCVYRMVIEDVQLSEEDLKKGLYASTQVKGWTAELPKNSDDQNSGKKKIKYLLLLR